VVAAVFFTMPFVAGAQQPATVPRIGYLVRNDAESTKHLLAAFRQGLRERGWIDGENIVLEQRYADGVADRVRPLVTELIRLKVDIIVTTSSATTWAAKDATKSIPIVMTVSADALGEGLVSSLAHPGANITGMTFLVGPEIAGKQLQLLKELVPAAARVVVLTNPSNNSHAAYIRELTAAARSLGAKLQIVEARSPEQLDNAFVAMTRERGQALLVLSDSMFLGQRRRIVSLAAANRLPAIYYQREFIDAGGLVSYGASLSDMFRRAAADVDKILKGAKPGDLPIEQPTKFELAINLKTAKSLGLAVPQTLLLRADEAIQ
jgi:putative ABC transport system substrate-binding protein